MRQHLYCNCYLLDIAAHHHPVCGIVTESQKDMLKVLAAPLALQKLILSNFSKKSIVLGGWMERPFYRLLFRSQKLPLKHLPKDFFSYFNFRQILM